MAKKFYTVLVLPDATSRARKFHISKTAITVVSSVLAVAFVAFGFFIHQYINLNVRLLELARLRREVQSHDAMVDRLFQVEKELVQLRELDGRLRLVAGLNPAAGEEAGAKALGMGGLQANVGKALDEAIRGDKLSVMERMSQELDQLAREMAQRMSSLTELRGHLEERRSAIAATPTIWPVRGLVTSGFGYRQSPFTGSRELHDGLDISAPHGTPVQATADGMVAYAGPLAGGYGNVVYLDHGHGFFTFYGHNSQNLVRTGARVRRGQIIAQVGNTGMSTGSHVHYSVRYKGVWVNPLKYIVEANPNSPELAAAASGPDRLPEESSKVKNLDQAMQQGGGAEPARPGRSRRR
ncbi:MAG TPA: M23 family metallopeptidase [Candidatus Sulfotelmatobacter sp.]|nr:M23 family metallopeptidase [Candidatus Sulfotelmatobacter sp.]